MNMEPNFNLCMKCMKRIGENPVCPHCGFNNRSNQTVPFLPLKSMLAGRYLVGAAIDHNGDGITYIGFDVVQKSPVYIREFFPIPISTRAQNGHSVLVRADSEISFNEFLRSFLSMWRLLARMRDLPILFPVYDIFEENNTAYSISEYSENITFRDYLLKNPTGQLSWDNCRRLIMPFLSSLQTLHTCGIVHMGISPTTMVIGRDGRLMLTGFSIREVRLSAGTLTSELPEGYAAIEQYNRDGTYGAWTDIYAVAAVIYRALVGNTPLDSKSRVVNDRLMVPTRIAENLPAYLLNALGNALQIYPQDRTRTVERFHAELSASPSIIENQRIQQPVAAPPYERNYSQNQYKQNPVNAPYPEEPVVQEYEAEPPATKSTPKAAIIVMIIIIVAILGLLVCFIFRDSLFTSDKEPETETIVETESAEEGEDAVPDLRGMSYDTVKAMYASQFEIVVEAEEYNEDFPRGTIIDQSVPKGSKITEGMTISIVLSKGIEQIRMIDVKGMPVSEAKAQLTAAGFVVDTIEIYNDGTHEENTVSTFDLQTNSTYDKGTGVVLQVWGKAPEDDAASQQ